MENKMKIEIWSDIVCPFCYIGKRKFEAALAQFQHKDKVEVVWKSFQLMPDMVTDPGISVYQMLSNKHGISIEQSLAMHTEVTKSALQSGLNYHFEIAIPANTSRAHQLIHFAKDRMKQDQAEEALFYSYFTEGKNIDDLDTLLEIGSGIGLDSGDLRDALHSQRYYGDVQDEINEAGQLGIGGVPFFVVDRKYGISGAQETGVFLETLEKAFYDWIDKNKNTATEIINGKSCTPDTECD